MAEFFEWCEENVLPYVNNFVKNMRTETLFNRMHEIYYELYGFVVKEGEMHKMVRRMKTVEEMSLFEHTREMGSLLGAQGMMHQARLRA